MSLFIWEWETASLRKFVNGGRTSVREASFSMRDTLGRAEQFSITWCSLQFRWRILPWLKYGLENNDWNALLLRKMLIPSFGCCVVTGFCKSILSVDIPFALHESTISQLKYTFCHLKRKREKKSKAKMKSCLSKNGCFVQEKKELREREEQGWFHLRALALINSPPSIERRLYT